jgi:predicted DNA-binding protein
MVKEVCSVSDKKTKYIHIRVSARLKDKLDEVAKKKDIEAARIVRDAIEDKLNEGNSK